MSTHHEPKGMPMRLLDEDSNWRHQQRSIFSEVSDSTVQMHVVATGSVTNEDIDWSRCTCKLSADSLAGKQQK